MKEIAFGVLCVLLTTSCGRSNQQGKQKEISEYPIITLNAQNVELHSVYPATIKGAEDIEIRPRVDGYIQTIYVDEGSVVKAGQPLFKIDSPSAEQALNSAKAAVASSEASANTAKLNVDRYRPLAEKGIVSEVQLQTHENAYASALAGLAQAEATLKNAQATMNWVTVSSPIAGVVGAIPFRTGSLVNSANTLTTVANTSNVFAHFSVNEKKLMRFLDGVEGTTQAEKIKNMPPVTLILADGTEYGEKGKIGTITGTVDVSTGAANFRAEFPNKAGVLRSGASSKVIVPKVLEQVFIIPQSATFSQQDKILVYQLQTDTVVQRLITVEPMPNGVEYAVTSGLNPSDKIVSDGIATLRNGMKIAVKE